MISLHADTRLQCYVRQLRGLRHEEQQLPPDPPEPASAAPGRGGAPGDPWGAGGPLTPGSLARAARLLRTMSSGSEAPRVGSPRGGGAGAECAVTGRQQLAALQRLFSAVMEDVISHMSGCGPACK